MTTKPRVYLTRRIPPQAQARLEAAVDLRMWDELTKTPRDIFLRELAEAEGVLTMLSEKVDMEALAQAPNLRVISNFAVGYDNINIPAATTRGIPVGHTPGVLTESSADLAFTLLMAGARRLVEGVNYVKNGAWLTWNPTTLLGQDIHGATLGIIGMGRIGAAVAKRGTGFGMHILGYGGSNDSYYQAVNAQRVNLDTLLTESDFVSINTPLNDATRGMIGSRELGLMKSTAVLINTARGPIVQTEALLTALQTGEIAYAALDVTDPEPLPADHPLVALDNCIVVPHMASASLATRERIGEIAIDNLLAGLAGEPLPHCVNPEVFK